MAGTKRPARPQTPGKPPRAGPKGRPGAGASTGRSSTGPAAAARAPAPTRSREDIRRRTLRAGVAFAVLAVVLSAGWYVGTKPRSQSAEARAEAAKAPAAAAAAGCTDVRTIPPYPQNLDRAHVGEEVPALPPLSSYPSTPPASGPHAPTPLDAGAYSAPPPIANAIHSLEHGAVIVWYAPSQASAAKDLATFFARPENRDHVIVAPYSYPRQGPAGSLPNGVGMAVVAWHRLQTCRVPSLPVAAAFVGRYAGPTGFLPFRLHPRGYLGDAPEAGFPI